MQWQLTTGLSWSHPLILLALGALLGCSGEMRDPYEPYPPDSWERRLPPALQVEPMERLAHDRFGVVPDAYQPEAQALLAANNHVLLSNEQAARYGLPAPTGPGADGLVVLLRGLEYERDESGLGKADGFHVYWRDGIVSVEHSTIRTRETPQRRRAIVAILPWAPRDTYAVPLSVFCDRVKWPWFP